MRTLIGKASMVAGIALAAVAGTAVPSLAAAPAGAAPQNVSVTPGPGGAGAQSLGVQPIAALACGLQNLSPGPGCKNRVSATTRNEQDTWNFGGAELGSAAANLVSSAVIGLPSLALDIIQGIFHAA